MWARPELRGGRLLRSGSGRHRGQLGLAGPRRERLPGRWSGRLVRCRRRVGRRGGEQALLVGDSPLGRAGRSVGLEVRAGRRLVALRRRLLLGGRRGPPPGGPGGGPPPGGPRPPRPPKKRRGRALGAPPAAPPARPAA